MTHMMKAVVLTAYGPPDVLELREVEKPTMAADQVLVKIRATSVSSMDWRFRNGKFPARLVSGVLRPTMQILGVDLAGEVEAVGKDVRRFKAGDLVYGGARHSCYAEYIALPKDGLLAAKPPDWSFEEAASVPFGAITALHFLRAGGIQSGQEVLINGASGSVGTLSVQIAKSFGATVTAVCSTGNLDLVRSLGADAVIDYTQEDFTKSGHKYDIIFDAVAKKSFASCKGALSDEGVYLTTETISAQLFYVILTAITGGKKVKTLIPSPSAEDLEYLNTLIEEGKVRAVIDRAYPLSQIVEAHRYAEQGHVKGKVVITVQD